MRRALFLAVAVCACGPAPETEGTGGGSGTAGGSSSTAGGASAGGGNSAAGGSATAGGATAGGGGSSGTAGGATAGGMSATAGGTGGAAGGAQGTGCVGATWKLCEDFESTNAGALPTGWTAKTGWNNHPATEYGVATDQHHGAGTKSFKSTTALPGQTRIQKALSSLGATANKHWGRVFYKVQNSPQVPIGANGAYYHVTFIGLQGQTESRVVDTVESPQRTIQYLYNLPDDSCCNGSSYNYAYDGAWHCAEWSLDTTAGSYRFFVDGAEVTSIAVTNNHNGGAKISGSNYSQLFLGPIFYVNPTGALTAWVDDLAIDDTRIGCN